MATEHSYDKLFNALPVSVTGAMPGDFLVGIKPGTKGMVLQIPIGGPTLPPFRVHMTTVYSEPEGRSKLTSILQNNPNFLRTTKNTDPSSWLNESALPSSVTDTSLVYRDFGNPRAFPGGRIRILDIGELGESNAFRTRLDSSTLEKFLVDSVLNPDNGISVEEVHQSFQKDPGSTKGPLIFFKDYWKVSTAYTVDNNVHPKTDTMVISLYDGTVHFPENDQNTGNLYNGEQNVVYHVPIYDNDTKIAFIVPSESLLGKRTLVNTALTSSSEITSSTKKQKPEIIDLTDNGTAPGNGTGTGIGIGTLHTDDLWSVSASALAQPEWHAQRLQELAIEWKNGPLKAFTPGALKSFVQKLIRFRPISVNVPKLQDDGTYIARKVPTNVALCIAMTLLYSHPGSLVPDIKRFVTGKESFCKRLAVIAVEDCSQTTRTDIQNLISLVGAAFLTQRVREWRPHNKLLLKWFQFGIGLLENTGITEPTEWKKHEKSPLYTVHNIRTMNKEPWMKMVLATCSLLMDAVGSFQGDLSIFRYLTNTFPKWKTRPDGYQQRPLIMNVWHCIDQHWYPNVVYALLPKTFKPMITGKKLLDSAPFKPVMDALFTNLTGYNPRRKKWDTFSPEETKIRKNFQDAQHMTWLALTAVTKKSLENNDTDTGTDTIKESYELEDAWIAGLVGQVTQTLGNRTYYVSMHSERPMELVAMPKPSRNTGKKDEEPIMDPKTEDEVLAQVRKQFRTGKGIRMGGMSKIPFPEFRGASVSLEASSSSAAAAASAETGDEQYFVHLNTGLSIPWDNVRRKDMIFTHRQASSNFKDTIERFLWETPPTTSIDRNWSKSLKTHADTVPISTLNRVVSLLSGHPVDTLKLPKIARDGGGSDIPVTHADVSSFWFLLFLSEHVPAALQRKPGKLTEFNIPNAPMLWIVYKVLRSHLQSTDRDKDTDTDQFLKWDRPGPRGPIKDQPLWSHQREAVNTMLGKATRGHFFWIPVGMGKTRILMEYLIGLMKSPTKHMPRYVLYATPDGTIDTVLKQLSKDYGFRVQLMVPLANLPANKKTTELRKSLITMGCTMKPYTINVVEHDHLRKCDELGTKISDTLFVYDEVHKAMSGKTLRTQMAQNLSNLSRDFVAMTGTAIVDNRIYTLKRWIEQIVPFSVTEQNFFVAVNSMIHQKITTGVRVDRILVMAPFTVQEEHTYKSLVPPAFGGTNGHPSVTQWQQAMTLSETVASRQMIDSIISYLDGGVFVVSKNKTHQTLLYNELMRRGVQEKDIFLVEKNKSLELTPETVASGNIHAYSVVITTKARSEGFSVTYLDTMVRSVYPSNQAVRSQLEGRINRNNRRTENGAKAPITIVTVYTRGLMEHIMKHHKSARNLESALNTIAKSINKP